MTETQLGLGFEPTALMSVDEIYQRATTELLMKLQEDRRIERKPAGIHAEHLGSIYFPMWANTPEGGLIVVGIEGDGRSPGGFPPFVTPQNIYEVHHPRNPTLMQAMAYLDYVKCAHEGTRRIRQTMADMELPTPPLNLAK